MNEYRLLIINADDLNRDTKQFVQTITGELYTYEIDKTHEYPISLYYSQVLNTLTNTMLRVFGKLEGQTMPYFFPRYMEALGDRNQLSELVGYIFLVNAEYSDVNQYRLYDFEKTTTSSHYAVNRANAQYEVLRDYDTDRPVVVASYNHHLENAVSR